MHPKGSKRRVIGLPKIHPSNTIKLQNGVSATPRCPAYSTYGIRKAQFAVDKHKISGDICDKGSIGQYVQYLNPLRLRETPLNLV